MADARLTAACDAYLLGRGLPSAPPDVAALMTFVEERAVVLSGVACATVAVADPALAAGRVRPSR